MKTAVVGFEQVNKPRLWHCRLQVECLGALAFPISGPSSRTTSLPGSKMCIVLDGKLQQSSA